MRIRMMPHLVAPKAAPACPRTIFAWLACLLVAIVAGCSEKPKQYGIETRLRLPSETEQVWAVAPAINLSGQRGVDALLQSDLLFKELQSVRGIRAIPVNRTAEVFASLGNDQVESPEQAQLVCELVGADALLVPTVTLYDPYDPPKMGAAIHVFARGGSLLTPAGALDMEGVRELSRAARGGASPGLPAPSSGAFLQETGIYDASHGSVRQALSQYAHGRHDPDGPAAGVRSYLLSMDRYAGFVYHELLFGLLYSLQQRNQAAPAAVTN